MNQLTKQKTKKERKKERKRKENLLQQSSHGRTEEAPGATVKPQGQGHCLDSRLPGVARWMPGGRSLWVDGSATRNQEERFICGYQSNIFNTQNSDQSYNWTELKSKINAYTFPLSEETETVIH